jgi:hypothetical protein
VGHKTTAQKHVSSALLTENKIQVPRPHDLISKVLIGQHALILLSGTVQPQTTAQDLGMDGQAAVCSRAGCDWSCGQTEVTRTAQEAEARETPALLLTWGLLAQVAMQGSTFKVV